jgi:hypothetical protein
MENEVRSEPTLDFGAEYEMKKTVKTKEDGRTLIFYNFVRKSDSSGKKAAGDGSSDNV